MSRKCALSDKNPMSGNNVSHAVNKTRRRFLPNLQNYHLMSDILGEKISLRLATGTVRTIDAKGGLDDYLLNASPRQLGDAAVKLRKRILKRQEKLEQQSLKVQHRDL